MKKLFFAFAALAALVSCQSLKEEWQPVFTFGDNEPAGFVPVDEATLREFNFDGTITTIKALKAMYKAGGVEVKGNTWIKGQVISSDLTGNVYRELYIQDETGGIDVKIGKSSLYSEYTLGQWVYVYCDGLTLGAYNGMPQLGLSPDETSTNEYETSYIDHQAIINQHIFRGEQAEPLQPVVVTEDMLKASINAGFTGELWGKLVTIKGMKYGSTKGIPEIFALFYPNSNLPHKSGNPENRVFLSTPQRDLVAGFDYTWGVTTWSCSKKGYVGYLQSGAWDAAEVGSGATHYGSIATTTPESKGITVFGPDGRMTYKDIMIKYANANYISHYFTVGSTDVQVRTSGYAKFADTKLDEGLRNGTKTADITGILTIYNGAAQFTLVDDPSVSVKLQ